MKRLSALMLSFVMVCQPIQAMDLVFDQEPWAQTPFAAEENLFEGSLEAPLEEAPLAEEANPFEEGELILEEALPASEEENDFLSETVGEADPGFASDIFVGETETTGVCGENLTWTLKRDGTLTIEGTGEMNSFNGYDVFAPWYSKKDEVLKVVLGEGVTSVGSFAFFECKKLSSVSLPSTLTAIYQGGFWACESLKSLSIPQKVTTLGKSVFAECVSLTSLSIPEGVEHIPASMASECANLTSVTLPKSVTTIGDSAFEDCSALTGVEIPQGVTSLGNGTFSECTSLQKLTLPEGVTSIGNLLMYECDSLTSITLPEGVTSIGEYAFYGCDSLTKMVIPDAVTQICYMAFANTGKIKSFSVGSANKSYTVKDGVLYSKDLTQLVACPGACPALSLPSSVTTLLPGCCYNCASLKSLTLPSSVTEIGEYAFAHCKGVKSLDLLASVTSLPSGCFLGCTGLTKVELPSSVTEIGNQVFLQCNSLSQVFLPEKLVSIGQLSFAQCDSLKSITLPASVKSIGDYALGYYLLKDVYTPISGFLIEGYAQTAAEAYANENDFLFRAIGGSSEPSSLVVGDEFVLDGAIYRITSKSAVSFIQLVSSAKKVKIPKKVTMKDTTYKVTSVASYAFAKDETITKVTIGKNITSIEAGAFQNAANLKTMVISSTKLKTIGADAFTGTDKSLTVTVPKAKYSAYKKLLKKAGFTGSIKKK